MNYDLPNSQNHIKQHSPSWVPHNIIFVIILVKSLPTLLWYPQVICSKDTSPILSIDKVQHFYSKRTNFVPSLKHLARATLTKAFTSSIPILAALERSPKMGSNSSRMTATDWRCCTESCRLRLNTGARKHCEGCQKRRCDRCLDVDEPSNNYMAGCSYCKNGEMWCGNLFHFTRRHDLYAQEDDGEFGGGGLPPWVWPRQKWY